MRTRCWAALAGPILLLATVAAPAARADNPIVRHMFTSNPVALVHDGRFWIFADHDEAPPGSPFFVKDHYHAFSADAPADDPEAWTDHGTVLAIEDFAWATEIMMAGHVTERDGTFYYYASVDSTATT